MNLKNEKGIALIMSIGIVAMLAIIGTTFAINMRLEQKASFNYLAGVKAKISAEGGIDAGIAAMKKYANDKAYDDPNDRWKYGYYSDEFWIGNGDATPGETFSNAIPCLNMNSASPVWSTNGLSNKIVKILNTSKQTSVAERIYKIDSNTANTLSFTAALSPVVKESDTLAFPIYLEGVVAATPANGSATLTCRNINGEFPSWEVSSLVDATTPLTIKFISGKASGKAFNITANTGNTLASTVGVDFGSTGQDVEINDEFIITLPSIPQISLNRWQARVIDCARQIYVNDRSSNTGTILDYLGAAIGSPLPTDIGTNDTYGIIDKRPSGGYLTKEDVRYMLRGNSDTIAQGEERYNAIRDFITVATYTDPTVAIECGGGATVTYAATSLTDTSKNWDNNWVGNYVMAYDGTNLYQIGNITANTATGLTVGSWNRSDGTATTPVTPGSQYAIFAPRPKAPINVNTARKEVLIAVIRGLSDGTAANTISETDAGIIADEIISNRITTPFTSWIGTSNSAFEYFVDNNAAIGLLTNFAEKRRILKANFNPNARWIGWNRNSSQETYAYLAKSDLAYNTTEFSFNSGGYYEIESFGLITDEIGNTISQKKIRTIAKVFDIWRQTTQNSFETGTKTDDRTHPEPQNGLDDSCNWDGQLMLVDLETDAAENFFAHYNDNLNGDSGGEVSSGTIDQVSVISASNRGDLFPDGVFIGNTETLTYLATGEIPSPAGTIEMWVKPQYTLAGTHYFFDYRNTTVNYMISLYDNSDTLTFNVSDGTTTQNDTKGGSIRDNTWHHLVGTWGNTGGSGELEVEIFVDGVSGGKATALAALSPGAVDGSFYVGSDINGVNQSESTIDEVKIKSGSVGSVTVPDRYVDATNGVFTSSTFDPPGGTNKWGTITWTEYIPAGISGDISFRVNVAGTWENIGNDPAPATPSDLRIDTSGLTIYYESTFSVDGNPLKDTPILDDVTITYFTPVRFFSWQEVVE